MGGTSAAVYPAAQLPSRAMTWCAQLIVIDPNPSLFGQFAHVLIRAPAEDALPVLVSQQ